MKLSTFLGSALAVLFAFSVISYAKTFIQAQDPKPVVKQEPVLDVAGQIPEVVEVSTADASPGAALEKADAAGFAVAAETYSATAYSLRGKTASGRFVTRGLIAADPRILPLGTRVRLDAGPWSGEYVVADTGGAIRGRKIDIWTPSSREALQFGRRLVKLTVLFYPPKSAKSNARPRVVKAATTPATTEPASKQEK